MKSKNTIFHVLILLLTLVFLLVSTTIPAIAQTNNPPGIDEDKVVVGQTFTLLENQEMNGDLAIIGGTATLKPGSVLNGNIALLGGALQVEGTINGDIQSLGGSIDLLSTALLDGDLYNFSSSITQANGAVITGEQVASVPFNFDWDQPDSPSLADSVETGTSRFFRFLGNVLIAILQIISMSALALVLVLIIPRPTLRVAKAIEKQPFVTWGIGLLTSFVFPLVVLVMILTLILIPLAAIAVIVFAIAAILGWIGLGYLIGLRLFATASKEMSPALQAAIGTFILSIIGRVIALIPCIGFLLVLFVGLTGLGAVILTFFGTRSYPLPTLQKSPSPTPTPRMLEPQIGSILADLEEDEVDDEFDDYDDIDSDLEDPESQNGGNK